MSHAATGVGKPKADLRRPRAAITISVCGEDYNRDAAYESRRVLRPELGQASTDGLPVASGAFISRADGIICSIISA